MGFRFNLKNPILFSKYFDIDKTLLEEAGLIDPFINVDTQLFIDPVLLPKSCFQNIKVDAYKRFRDHFNNYVRLLAISENEGDAAWRAACKLLNLREPPQTGLGYGGAGRSGSSRPEEIRDAIMRTSKEIVHLGSKDPEMISLMAFFEEKVGPDTISDFTTHVIMQDLAELTEKFCVENKVPTSKTMLVKGVTLPKIKGKPIILVPRDIVRDLPIANDWTDIEDAALKNEKIRQRVNAHLAEIAKPTIADKKAAMRSAALESGENFDEFIRSVKESATSYDANVDALAYYKIREILRSDLEQFRVPSKPEIKSPEALRDFIKQTIEHFKHHVEYGNLWEELWIGNEPKKERAAQLIYFAIADCFCIANDVDISPEANMGGGPIDFKFSRGYKARVLVEMKRDSGTVKHGYEKQLEIYKDASRTNFGIFVVMDYGQGKLGTKLIQIQTIQRRRLEAGEQASEIMVIDASKKASASKRT